jgi:hypothetical protein
VLESAEGVDDERDYAVAVEREYADYAAVLMNQFHYHPLES